MKSVDWRTNIMGQTAMGLLTGVFFGMCVFGHLGVWGIPAMCLVLIALRKKSA